MHIITCRRRLIFSETTLCRIPIICKHLLPNLKTLLFSNELAQPFCKIQFDSEIKLLQTIFYTKRTKKNHIFRSARENIVFFKLSVYTLKPNVNIYILYTLYFAFLTVILQTNSTNLSA